MTHPLAPVRSSFRGFLEDGVVPTEGPRGGWSSRRDPARRQDYNVINGMRRKGPDDANFQYATATVERVWQTQPHLQGKHDSFHVAVRNAQSGRP